MKTEIKISISKVNNGYWIVSNGEKYIADAASITKQARRELESLIKKNASSSEIGITIQVDSKL